MSWWRPACPTERHPAWTAVPAQALPLAPLDPAGRGSPAQEDAGVERGSTGGWRGPPPSSWPQAEGQGPTTTRGLGGSLSPPVHLLGHSSFTSSPVPFIPSFLHQGRGTASVRRPYSELGERHRGIRGSSSPTAEQPERKGLPEARQDTHVSTWLRRWASALALDLASGQMTGWGPSVPARLGSSTRLLLPPGK